MCVALVVVAKEFQLNFAA